MKLKIFLIFIILLPSSLLQASSDDYALSLYNSGTYELAYQAFFNLHKDSNAEQDKSLYYMALCKFKLQQYEASQKLCYDFMKEYPVSLYRPKISFLLAKIEQNKNNKVQAIRAFLKVKSKYPKSKEAFSAQMNIAKIYTELERYDEAEDIYMDLLKNKHWKTEKVSIYFALAQLKEKEGKTDDSINYYKKIIFSTTDIDLIAKAQYSIAEIFLSQEKYEEALQKYNQILEKFSQLPWKDELHYKMAFCLQKMGKNEASLKAYNNLKTTNSILQKNILYRKSEIFYTKKLYSQALTNFLNLTNDILFKEKALSYLTKIYIHNENYDKALDVLQTMTNKKLKYLSQGEIYTIQKKYPQAIQAYLQYLKISDSIVDKDKIYFKIGKIYFIEKDYNNAITYLKPLYQNYPSSVYLEEAIFLIANSYQEKNDIDQSLVYYNKLMNYSTNNSWLFKAKFGLAKIYQQSKEYKKSNSYFLELAHAAQTNKGSYFYEMAINFDKLKETKKYIQYLQLALHSDKTSKEILNLAFEKLQIYYFERKDYKNYIKLLKFYSPLITDKEKKDKILFEILNSEFIRQDYDSFLADFKNYQPQVNSEKYLIKINLLKGKIFFNTNQYNKALSLLQSTYSNTKNKERNYALFDIGSIYLKKNNIDLAQKYYEKFISSKINQSMSSDIYYNLGQYFYRQKNYLKARQYFSKLIFNFPSDELSDDALFWKANSYFAEKNYTKAIDTFKTLIKSFKNSEFTAQAYFKIGEAYYLQNQYSQAIVYYKTVINKFPLSSVSKTATYKLAQCYKHTKNIKKAIPLFKQFSEGNSSDYYSIKAKFELAVYYFENSDYKKAIPFLIFAKQNSENLKPQATFLLAESYRLSKEFELANKEYALIVHYKYKQYMPQSLYYLAYGYDRLNKKDVALDYYKKTKKFFPNTVWAKKANTKIIKLEQGE